MLEDQANPGDGSEQKDNVEASGPVVGAFHVPKKDRLKNLLSKKIAIIFAVVIAISLGSMFYFLRDDGRSGVTSPCSGLIVQEYNRVLTSKLASDYQSGLQALTERIESINGQDDDITCAYILYEYYSFVRDAKATAKHVNNYESLSSKGQVLDDGIIDPDGISMMRDKLRGLEPGEEPNDSGGQG